MVEVLVSSVILMLVLGEMLGGFAGGRLLSRRSRDRLIALGFARERLEEFLSKPYSSLVAGENFSDSVFRTRYGPGGPQEHEFVTRTCYQDGTPLSGTGRFYKIEIIYDEAGRECYKNITMIVRWKFLRSDVTYSEALATLYYNPNYLVP